MRDIRRALLLHPSGLMYSEECALELGIVAAINNIADPSWRPTHEDVCVAPKATTKPIAAYSASRFEMETRKTGLLFSAGSMT